MPLLRINNSIVFFVHIPKTGGTSIENTLAELGSISIHRKPVSYWVPPQHWHAELYNVVIPPDFYDLGFLVCRNPYVRLLSEFCHRSRRDAVKELGFDRWTQKILDGYGTDNFIYYNHIRPQSDFYSKNIKVFKYEDGLQRVVNEVAAFCQLRRRMKIRSDKVWPRPQCEVARGTLRRIASFYKSDFKLFGYDPFAVDILTRRGVSIT